MRYGAAKTLTAVSALWLGFSPTLQAADGNPYIQYIDCGLATAQTISSSDTQCVQRGENITFGELSDIIAIALRNDNDENDNNSNGRDPRQPRTDIPITLTNIPTVIYERGEDDQGTEVRRMVFTFEENGETVAYAVNLPPEVADDIEGEVLHPSLESEPEALHNTGTPSSLQHVETAEPLTPVNSSGTPLSRTKTGPTPSFQPSPVPSYTLNTSSTEDSVLVIETRLAGGDPNDISLSPNPGGGHVAIALRSGLGLVSGAPPTRSYVLAIGENYPVVLVETIKNASPPTASPSLPPTPGENVPDQFYTGIPDNTGATETESTGGTGGTSGTGGSTRP